MSRSSISIVSAGITLLGGLALGAGALYLLDPSNGPARRKNLRNSTGRALHSAGDLLNSAYSAAGDTAANLLSQSHSAASDLLSRSHESAANLLNQNVPEAEQDEDGICPVTMISLILGGSALAAAIYVLTTEYDTIRRGDFSGAVQHAYHRAADTASSTTQYVRDTAADLADRATHYLHPTESQSNGIQTS